MAVHSALVSNNNTAGKRIILHKLSTHIVLQYDGVLNDDHTPYLVDLVNHGSVIIPDFDSVVPEQFIDPDIPYHRYVKGSEWARMTIFGELDQS